MPIYYGCCLPCANYLVILAGTQMLLFSWTDDTRQSTCGRYWFVSQLWVPQDPPDFFSNVPSGAPRISFRGHAGFRYVDNYSSVKGNGSPCSITERRVPELIPVLGSQPAGDVNHKPDGRLPLFSARPAVTPATFKRVLPISLLGEQEHSGCEQFAKDCYPTASRLRFEPGPFCA